MRTYQTAIPPSCFNFPTTLRKNQRNASQVSSLSAVSSRYEFFRTLANWRLGSHRRLFTLLFPQQRVASVNSRQVVGRPIYLDRSLSVAISREGKRRSIEILAVPKINYGMSARRWRRRWRRRRRRRLDGYFPGNSSRGRLEGFEAWSTRIRLLQLPANSVDVIRQQFQQHSRHIVGSRVSRNVPTRRHISGDASSSGNHEPLYRTVDLYSCPFPLFHLAASLSTLWLASARYV